MKQLRHLPVGVLGMLLVVSSLGCASRPDEALKLAQTAMEQAKQEQAADFAPSDWKSAQKAWDDAQAALARQRNSEAAALLTTCKIRFEKARAISKAKRDDVRKEVSLMQSTVNTRFSALKDSVSKSRLTGKAQKDLTQSCQDVETAIDKFNTEVLSDQLIQARTSGQVALGKLNEAERKLIQLTKGPAS
jgi:superfamily I DNA and RNA helicase